MVFTENEKILNNEQIFSDKWRLFVSDLYDCYLLALKEYTIDSRGDIGAWVREAAMNGLHVREIFHYGKIMRS